MSEMSNTEEREDTACIEITCSVKVTNNVILLLMWSSILPFICFVLFEH